MEPLRRLLTGRRRWPARPIAVAFAIMPLFLGGFLATRLGLPGSSKPAAAVSYQIPDARLQYFHFHTDELDRYMPIKVYLPPGYESGSQRYPVLYLLHGLDPKISENWEWQEYGLLDKAERMMKTGEVQPFIIVLPQGEQSYWFDHVSGPPWGEYLAQDVVNLVDGRYRTVTDASHRAVGGLSMGADGALQIALNHPDVFGVVGVHSPALRSFEFASADYGDWDYFEAHFPLALLQKEPDVARNLIIELDAGYQDEWLGSAEELHNELVDLGIPHAYNRWPGHHDGFYWGGHAEDYLRFYSAALSKPLG